MGDVQSLVISLDNELKPRANVDRPAVEVPQALLLKVLEQCRNRPELNFDMLLVHTAIDYISENRIELVYLLYSTQHQHELFLTTSAPRMGAIVDSACSLWKIAEWQEREVYDMFGVKYRNHPDLRRILLEDDWKGHPLLKDYKDDFMLERPW